MDTEWEAASALISMRVELGVVKLGQLDAHEVKIYLAVDANGHPLDFEITGGEVHDSQVAPQIRESARKHGMIPVISRKSNSTKSNPELSRYLYGLGHVVENAFARLKYFRGIAMRFDKLAHNYKPMRDWPVSVFGVRLNTDAGLRVSDLKY